jgi:N-acetylglutamate synthase-like GNAT family acetyltransferase
MTPRFIRYQVGGDLDFEVVIDVYNTSKLGERRVVDRSTVENMLAHANLIVTAWDNTKMVGIARTFTDFSHVGYLSDIAVRESHQDLGIGAELIRLTQQRMGPRASLMLLASPTSVDYFLEVGFKTVEGATILRAERRV